MKKLLLLLVSFLMASMAYADVNNVYIVGTGDDTAWCCGEFWSATGCPMPGGVYTVTVQPGTYYCKVVVVQGSYINWLGWDYLSVGDSNPGVYKDGDGNMFFTVASEAEITVTYSDWSVAITSPVPFVEVPITSWTLTGFGNNDITNTKYDFTETSEGVFTLNLSDVSLLQGDAFYNAYANHRDDIKLITGENAIIPVTGVYNIDVTLVPATNTLTAELTKVGDITPDIYIVGAGDDTAWCCGEFWSATGCRMPGGVYTVTVQPGTYYCKVVVVQGPYRKWLGWDSLSVGDSNPGVYKDGDGNMFFTVASEAEITVTYSDWSVAITSPVPFIEVPITSWTLTGFGNNDITDTKYDFTETAEGVFTLNLSDVSLLQGDAFYNAYANHRDDIKLITGENAIIPVTGVYNIDVTLVPATNTLTAELTKVGDITPDIYIVGAGDDTAWCCGEFWSATGCRMPGGVYTVTVQPGTYYCKVVVVQGPYRKWLGWDSLSVGDSNPGVYKDRDGNMFFTVSSEAEVTVTYSDWSVAITSPVPFIEVPITSWTLTGFGNNDESDTDYDFTETSEGVFTLNLSDVSLLQGDVLYSAYANHRVDIKCVEGEDAIIPVTGVYDIDLTLVPAANTLTAELTKVSDITPDNYIAGTGSATNNWCCGLFWEDGCPMTDGIYTTTVEAGEYWFKVIIKVGDDSKWLGCNNIDPATSTPGYVVQNPEYDGNIGFTVDQTAEITVSFSNGKISLVSSVPFANSVPTIWKSYLEDGLYPMSLVSDGKYQAIVSNITLYAQEYPWTIKGWYEGFELDAPAVTHESTLSVGVAGVYDVTFTVDTDNEEFEAALSLVTSINEATADAIYAANGTIFCSVPFEVYSMSGVNVTAQNGNLSGIYIVKTADKAQTILVK